VRGRRQFFRKKHSRRRLDSEILQDSRSATADTYFEQKSNFRIDALFILILLVIRQIFS
jgi:hypothetical protein